MASNKHHELTKLAMNQVADLLPDFTVRQENKFVNVQNEFPLIIKFDYVGKWRLKGVTRMYVVVGVELRSDYTYFNTARTWVNAKRKFYITNFMCSRIGLLPQATEWYLLEKKDDVKVGAELLTHELTDYFLPYLNQLTSLDGMVSLLRREKPSRNKLLDTSPIYGRKYLYDWHAVIYLLLHAKRKAEAERCVEEVISLINSLHLPADHVQVAVITLNKLHSRFEIDRAYTYSERTNTIVGKQR